MNATSNNPHSHAPHLRQRGARIITHAHASVIPTPMATSKAICLGNSICTIRCSAASGSTSFQKPETRNSAASRTAHVQPIQYFQAAGGTGTCGILSTMLPIVALLAVVLVIPAAGQTADLIIENANIYTVNKEQP